MKRQIRMRQSRRPNLRGLKFNRPYDAPPRMPLSYSPELIDQLSRNQWR